MKLKQWLKEYKEMTYADYMALEDIDRWSIEGEFREFNNREIRIKQAHEKMIQDGVTIRQMTEEEMAELEKRLDAEHTRYEKSLKIGGVDGRGNYTALHHRWDKRTKNTFCNGR